MKSHSFRAQKAGTLIAQRTRDLQEAHVASLDGTVSRSRDVAKSTTERIRMPLPGIQELSDS